MNFAFILIIVSCIAGLGQSNVYDKTSSAFFGATNVEHFGYYPSTFKKLLFLFNFFFKLGFEQLHNQQGTDIGCPGCPFYNGGNCFQCCVENGHSSGGSCGGFMFMTCFCV